MRSDNRAMAIAIALARTTRPASCPPIRRVLSGRVADTVVASGCLGSFLAWLDDDDALVPDVGETVGNSPEGSVGVVNAPLGSGGNDVPGSVLPGTIGAGGSGGVGELGETTLIVALAWKEVAPPARAVAVSVIRSPTEAAAATRAAATISADWLVGKSPTVQTVPFRCGHTVNRGAATLAAFPALTVTVAPWASAPVLHTQIA